MNDRKICPLLPAVEPGVPSYCRANLCAWYIPPMLPGHESHCAVQCLGALPDLIQAVRAL